MHLDQRHRLMLAAIVAWSTGITALSSCAPEASSRPAATAPAPATARP